MTINVGRFSMRFSLLTQVCLLCNLHLAKTRKKELFSSCRNMIIHVSGPAQGALKASLNKSLVNELVEEKPSHTKKRNDIISCGAVIINLPV